MSLYRLCITSIIVLAVVKSRLGNFALMYLLIKLSVAVREHKYILGLTQTRFNQSRTLDEG